MPTIFANTIEGLSLEQKKDIFRRITEVTSKDVGVAETAVRIIWTERKPGDMSVGGYMLDDGGLAGLYPIFHITTKTGKSEEMLKNWRQHISEVVADVARIPVEKISVYFWEQRI